MQRERVGEERSAGVALALGLEARELALEPDVVLTGGAGELGLARPAAADELELERAGLGLGAPAPSSDALNAGGRVGLAAHAATARTVRARAAARIVYTVWIETPRRAAVERAVSPAARASST
jgi:hypothetical protein